MFIVLGIIEIPQGARTFKAYCFKLVSPISG